MPSSAFNSLFPTVDFSKLSDNNYMRQFTVGGYGGYGGDSGQYADDSFIQLIGADGKTYRMSPGTGASGYSFTASDPLDNHNRFQVDFDQSGNLTANQNWKDKSFWDDNKGIIAVLGAAAGGYAAFGGGAGGAAAEGLSGMDLAADTAGFGGSYAGGVAPSVALTPASVGGSGGVTGVTAGSGATSAGGGLFSGFGGGSGAAGGGAMDWGSIAKTGASLFGGYLQNQANTDAAKQSAEAQLRAAQVAADAAKFRPVGVTSRFGSSGFQFDANGNLIGAGYQVDPTLAAFREKALSSAGQSGLSAIDKTAQAGNSLFNLGSQYLATSPEQAASQWMSAQQNLLAPSRERQLAAVRNGLFNTGRTGLAVGATGARPDGSAGLNAANPEMEAYYNALAQQDAQLATQAQQQGRDSVAFGAGLFNTGTDIMNNGYKPFQTALGTAGTIEGMGQDTLNIGAQLGGRTAQAGAQAGQFLFSGGRNAATTMQPANQQSFWGSALSGLGNSTMFQNGVNNATSSIWN